ncbi:MAG: tryptophan synthase alpha chain [Gammaproteobacteria bacterium]|nr:MAG: tryptophan synthase alpha chain [Gammaproteobacteria bacterium]TND07396.1 MAG: tryptophan synthase alpha chain [Gammaproteobacteria bacterium]
MSRIEQCFAQLRAQGRKALIPYVTAGDPQPDVTVPLLHAMVAAGADIVELGVPFSDPMADGPVIQRASERALAHHVSLRDVLGMVREFRRRDDVTPVVLMGYLNPVEMMGYEAFAQAAQAAGVDGVLTVDLPPEEAAGLVDALRSRQLDPIFLIAPTSTLERIERICANASGFVYYVSLKGVTGAATLDVASVAARLAQIREVTSLPVGVGFGIRDAESAARVAAIADAVVVGSALVKTVEAGAGRPQEIAGHLRLQLGEMRAAMDNAVADAVKHRLRGK